jgi:hypothetical protein
VSKAWHFRSAIAHSGSLSAIFGYPLGRFLLTVPGAGGPFTKEIAHVLRYR